MAETAIQSDIDRVFRKIGITGQAAAILMIIFGILIIVFPDLVAWLIGLYLIVVGLVQFLGSLEAGRTRSATPPTSPPTTPPT